MIARLRELLAAATPGPWVRTASGITQAADDGGPDYGEIADPAPDDAVLIVAAVNAIPALLDRLEAAEVVVEAARGCGDRACILRDRTKDAGGMRTNGGCDCRRSVLHALRRYDEVRR